MRTIIENNTEVEYLTQEIIHVSFRRGGYLSTQLIRELSVMSKVDNGVTAKAYLISIEELPEDEEILRRICKKAERFTSGTIIAIVSPESFSLKISANLMMFKQRTKSIQVFTQFIYAKDWIQNKIDSENQNIKPNFTLEFSLQTAG